MRKALIDNTNTVVNVIEIEADAAYTPPAGLTLAGTGNDPNLAIGGTFDPSTGSYTPPPTPPAPPPDPRDLLLTQLANAGIITAAITAGATTTTAAAAAGITTTQLATQPAAGLAAKIGGTTTQQAAAGTAP